MFKWILTIQQCYELFGADVGCLSFYLCDEHICYLALGITSFSTNNIGDAVAADITSSRR